ncbi:hypothetical protein [Mucilaginibacter sp. PAMB04168]|uniref:hypothetical protein n=1 Tax=Mucilaginibacter sp. PAMB04168 TaxID=3138567 RepID=UPI0031F64393
MKLNLTSLKTTVLLTAFTLLTAFAAQGQDKIKTIGNKPRTGSSNATFAVAKGQQIGVKMNAGNKPVQLLNLNFGSQNDNRDSLGFKVNVYDFSSNAPGDNLIKQDIIAYIPHGNNRINVDLAPYNIRAKGAILVAIEWLTTHKGSEPHFFIGLFNGGTYRNEGAEWKKMAVAGVDFNIQVKQLQ